jgi:transcriptional regulator with XRE-family HTH domain
VVWGDVAQGLKNPLHLGIPYRLSNSRSDQGLAASSLGYAARLSSSVVAAIEDSVALPKIDTIEKLACALGVPACWLAFGQEGPLEWAQRRRAPRPRAAFPVPVPGGIPYTGSSQESGQRLRLKRESLGLSLRQLAEAAGVSFETIRKIENGRAIPKVDTCERLAVALGVSPCWLAFGVGVSN